MRHYEYHGNGSDSRERGYVGEGRVIATARLYISVLRVHAPHGEGNSPTSLCLRGLSIGVWSYRGCKPLCQRGGMAYIECADPWLPSITQGFNEEVKSWMLLVTPVFNDLYGCGVNDRPLLSTGDLTPFVFRVDSCLPSEIMMVEWNWGIRVECGLHFLRIPVGIFLLTL